MSRRLSAGGAIRPLEGHVAWVVGGAGVVGQGITRGLLNAGAFVIVNSRHPQKLQKLSEELDHPEQLVTINASMLPDSADKTVSKAMEISGNRLDHVVAHSAVRWWDADGGDETTTVSRGPSLLHVSPMEYAQMANQLGSLHYATAHLLTPLLSDEGSFTFVTSNADSFAGRSSAMAQINAHGVMGLAAAMRSEAAVANWKARVGELRLGPGLRLNRSKSEREADPRETPLSHDIGRVAAGIAAKGTGGLVQAADLFEFELLKQQYA